MCKPLDGVTNEMAGMSIDKRKASQAAWVQVIEGARKHAGGVRAYCEKNDIAPKQYYRWFGKLKAEHPEWAAQTVVKPAVLAENQKKRLREFWTEKYSQWQTSGLSQAAYCQKNAIGISSFGKWKSKLEMENQPQPAKRRQSKFVKLALSPDADEKRDSGFALNQRPQSTGAMIVAELIDEFGCLRIYEGAEPQIVASIFSAIRSRS